MRDAIFIAQLSKLVPDELKEKIFSKPTSAEGAACFLDKAITSNVELQYYEPFNNLLSVMETSSNISLKYLSDKIKQDIIKKNRSADDHGKNTDYLVPY